MMAGVILVAFGNTGMGRLIQYVPYPVVLGFTAGIAVVIAVLQVPDFLGLRVGQLGEHFVDNLGRIAVSLPGEVALYDIDGPLFFGAAEKALTSLHLVDPKVRVVILDMHDVPSMDGTAIVALKALIDEMHREGVALVLVGLPARILVKLRRAGIRRTAGRLTWCRELTHARKVALRWLDEIA